MSTLAERTERGWGGELSSDRPGEAGSPAAARGSPQGTPRLGEGSLGRQNRSSLKSSMHDSCRSEAAGSEKWGSGRMKVTFGGPAPAPSAENTKESHV